MFTVCQPEWSNLTTPATRRWQAPQGGSGLGGLGAHTVVDSESPESEKSSESELY